MAGKAYERVTKISTTAEINSAGVVRHHHGDGRWHWVQDKHSSRNPSGTHAETTDVKTPVWVGTFSAAGLKAAKALYAIALAGETRVPIRVQRRGTPVAPVVLAAEVIAAAAEAGFVLA